jgi:hypothetical protein
MPTIDITAFDGGAGSRGSRMNVNPKYGCDATMNLLDLV